MGRWNLERLNEPFRLGGQILVPPGVYRNSGFELANDEEDKREFCISFQILQGSDEIWVTEGGTGKEKVNYDGEKLAAGKFELDLPELEPGDHTFLPPSQGANPQSLAVSVMHTFRLMEP